MHPLLVDADESRVYFQVMIAYEDCEATSMIPKESRLLESQALPNLTKANQIAKNTIEAIQGKFPGSELIEISLDQAQDGYHLIVVDEGGQSLARVGISAIDYSNETLH